MAFRWSASIVAIFASLLLFSPGAEVHASRHILQSPGEGSGSPSGSAGSSGGGRGNDGRPTPSPSPFENSSSSAGSASGTALSCVPPLSLSSLSGTGALAGLSASDTAALEAALSSLPVCPSLTGNVSSSGPAARPSCRPSGLLLLQLLRAANVSSTVLSAVASVPECRPPRGDGSTSAGGSGDDAKDDSTDTEADDSTEFETTAVSDSGAESSAESNSWSQPCVPAGLADQVGSSDTAADMPEMLAAITNASAIFPVCPESYFDGSDSDAEGADTDSDTDGETDGETDGDGNSTTTSFPGACLPPVVVAALNATGMPQRRPNLPSPCERGPGSGGNGNSGNGNGNGRPVRACRPQGLFRFNVSEIPTDLFAALRNISECPSAVGGAVGPFAPLPFCRPRRPVDTNSSVLPASVSADTVTSSVSAGSAAADPSVAVGGPSDDPMASLPLPISTPDNSPANGLCIPTNVFNMTAYALAHGRGNDNANGGGNSSGGGGGGGGGGPRPNGNENGGGGGNGNGAFPCVPPGFVAAVNASGMLADLSAAAAAALLRSLTGVRPCATVPGSSGTAACRPPGALIALASAGISNSSLAAFAQRISECPSSIFIGGEPTATITGGGFGRPDDPGSNGNGGGGGGIANGGGGSGGGGGGGPRPEGNSTITSGDDRPCMPPGFVAAVNASGMLADLSAAAAAALQRTFAELRPCPSVSGNATAPAAVCRPTGALAVLANAGVSNSSLAAFARRVPECLSAAAPGGGGRPEDAGGNSNGGGNGGGDTGAGRNRPPTPPRPPPAPSARVCIGTKLPPVCPACVARLLNASASSATTTTAAGATAASGDDRPTGSRAGGDDSAFRALQCVSLTGACPDGAAAVCTDGTAAVNGTVSKLRAEVSGRGASPRLNASAVLDIIASVARGAANRTAGAANVSVVLADLPVVANMSLPNVTASQWGAPGFQNNLTRAIARDLGVNQTQVALALADAAAAAAAAGALAGRRRLSATALDITVTVSGFGENTTAANAVADGLHSTVGGAASSTTQTLGTVPSVSGSTVTAQLLVTTDVVELPSPPPPSPPPLPPVLAAAVSPPPATALAPPPANSSTAVPQPPRVPPPTGVPPTAMASSPPPLVPPPTSAAGARVGGGRPGSAAVAVVCVSALLSVLVRGA